MEEEENEVDHSQSGLGRIVDLMTGPHSGKSLGNDAVAKGKVSEVFKSDQPKTSRRMKEIHGKKVDERDHDVGGAITSVGQSSSSSSEFQPIVTTTTTTTNTTSSNTTATTSSSASGGDDDDRKDHTSPCSRRKEDIIASGGQMKSTPNQGRQGKRKVAVLTRTERDPFSPRKKPNRQDQHDQDIQKNSWDYNGSNDSLSPNDDGSALQVPGDDGSDRIVAEDIEGGVPRKPATVVASRLFTPYERSSNGNSSGSSTGTGNGEGRRTAQHHLLLPPHREPGYHTIRDTLYRFQGSDSNSNSNSRKMTRNYKNKSERKTNKTFHGSTDASSNEDALKNTLVKKLPMCNHSRHRNGNPSSASRSNTSSEGRDHKRNKKRSRTSRASHEADSTSRVAGSISLKNPTEGPSHQKLMKAQNTEGSSSGSGSDGTEDGYAGSVSSNENGSGNQLGSSSPSPSVTSSEEGERDQDEGRQKRKRNNSKRKSSIAPDSSSEIADFSSSGTSETVDIEDFRASRQESGTKGFAMKNFATSSSHTLSSSNFTDSDGLEMAYLSAKRDADAEHKRVLKAFDRKKKAKNSPRTKISHERLGIKSIDDGRPPILSMGCDIMAHILTFLVPPEILDVLTMPLSKEWRKNFTSQPELWRVLCLVEPFKATVENPNASSHRKTSKESSVEDGLESSSDESHDCVNSTKDNETTKGSLDKYRLLYTSFVRCMKYIAQIQDDAINGRQPAYIDYGISGTAAGGATPQMIQFKRKREDRTSPPPPASLGSNRNLQLFLAQARDIVLSSSNDNNEGESKVNEAPQLPGVVPMLSGVARVGTAHRKSERTARYLRAKNDSGPKYGRSMITKRLFGSTAGGEPANLKLPWSCAIYSIVNWMVAFSDVEGLQILCMKVLPTLLENEQHRLTAQHAGLADVVLCAMVIFSESVQLHIAAFHTIVLLARPHGGREGMMFRTSMTSDGIFRGMYQRHGKSGIAVMLDSMKRFEDNATLSAMSCWALVNIALVADQKAVLVKLGGIQAITNAMYRHPYSAELQFRAMFALINLVIPSVRNIENGGIDGEDTGGRERNQGANERTTERSQPELGELNETTEREIIDELVGDIASLVIRVMKNFCSSEAILNRACLVLHNLSLTDDYHVILLWTPHCYQMLEWCIANFRTDQVLQQSATGTLHRLQTTLASDNEMRSRFTKTLRAQQQQINLKHPRIQGH